MAKTETASSNSLVELLSFGQSVWYDNIGRDLIKSGELKRMIVEDGLRGVTSNPTIFEKAITGSATYKNEVRDLHRRGKTIGEIYETLAVADIQAAADVLRPVWEESGGVDGYVSLEVSPTLAHDTAGTIKEAISLHGKVGRKNLMVKVPATPEGLPAIERLIGEGLSINVTLIFNVDHYIPVAEAYLRGLEALERSGKRLDSVASVASAFVSRVDSAVDKILTPNREARDFLGKAGIANIKMMYAKFREIFGGPRFARLKNKGARVQRPLWASTGVKNPRYSDVLYAEELIGPDTVDTMPPATMAAFKDHGVPASRLGKDLEGAPWVIGELAQFGIDLKAITEDLQKDGVESFAKSWAQLMKGIESQATSGESEVAKSSVVRYRPWLNDVYQMIDDRRFIARVWQKDPSLWHHQMAHHAIIKNSLGWLSLPESMAKKAEELKAFADEIKKAGFKHVVLLGIGGSSLAAEVYRDTFGGKAGFPELRVIDSSDPATIARLSRGIDSAKTLFVVASKSGGTSEVSRLQKYFHDKVKKAKGDAAGENFVAVTDKGSSLERLAKEQGFRRVFFNPKDMPGRFSALSYFGLVPAALVGTDVKAVLAKAQKMAQECGPSVAVRDDGGALGNPGAQLGALLGEAALHGRDKLTLVLSDKIATLGSWIEQLVSESTGKEGGGILTVVGEELGDVDSYGRDRVFVTLTLPKDAKATEQRLQKLEAAGHPVVRIPLSDPTDVGAEFFRWEFATAIAAAVLGVDPFDQPDVQESKEATRQLVAEYGKRKNPPKAKADKASGLGKFLDQARDFDYVALLAYADRNAKNQAALDKLRAKIRDTHHVATTVEFGPRYLHSVGQIHKGGANNGLFVLITAGGGKDIKIPGEPISFGALEQAQALGDLAALRKLHRRAVHLHLSGDAAAGIKKLVNQVK